jgi:hypothetical protein
VKKVPKAKDSAKLHGMAKQTAVIQAGNQLSDSEEEADDRWRVAMDELSPEDRDHLEKEAEGATAEEKLEMLRLKPRASSSVGTSQTSCPRPSCGG